LMSRSAIQDVENRFVKCAGTNNAVVGQW
jgi:hypothetical protein